MMAFPDSKKMFKKAIEAFHPHHGKEYFAASKQNVQRDPMYGFLTTDFNLSIDWEFEEFTIERSIVFPHGKLINGSHEVKSFISPVKLPEWVTGPFNQNLFLLALSALCSFSIERPVISPKMETVASYPKMIDLSNLLKINPYNTDQFISRKVEIFIENSDIPITGTIISCFGRRPKIKESYVTMEIEGKEYLQVALDENFQYIRETPTSKGIILSVNVYFFQEYESLAYLLPTKVRGVNIHAHDIHIDWLNIWKERIDTLLTNINKLTYQSDSEDIDYVSAMQTIRLIQMSHINHQEDFGLSFCLLISGTESIAKCAINSTDIEEKSYSTYENLDELRSVNDKADTLISAYLTLKNSYDDKSDSDKKYWRELRGVNEDLKSILADYGRLKTELRGNPEHRYLGERFTQFILRHYPYNNWEVIDDKYLTNPIGQTDRIDLLKAIRAIYNIEVTSLQPHDVKKLIKDTYTYRSNYIHSGESSPHNEPVGEGLFLEKVVNQVEFDKLKKKLKKENRTQFEADEAKKMNKLLISHILMRSISRNSISNFIAKAANK